MPVSARVRARYLNAIEPWRHGRGYRVPGTFVIATAVAPVQNGKVGGPKSDSAASQANGRHLDRATDAYAFRPDATCRQPVASVPPPVMSNVVSTRGG